MVRDIKIADAFKDGKAFIGSVFGMSQSGISRGRKRCQLFLQPQALRKWGGGDAVDLFSAQPRAHRLDEQFGFFGAPLQGHGPLMEMSRRIFESLEQCQGIFEAAHAGSQYQKRRGCWIQPRRRIGNALSRIYMV